MYQPNFFQRLREFGIRNLILSFDTLVGIITLSILYIYTDGWMAENLGASILPHITLVSATLFAIILTGFTVITSFTDRYFLYAWKEIGKFSGIVTLFQYNLTIPIFIIILSFVLFIHYNGLAMIVLISLFIYMITSLLLLVGFISKYTLQSAEFIKQAIEEENSQRRGMQQSAAPHLSIDHLEEINERLSELESLQEESN